MARTSAVLDWYLWYSIVMLISEPSYDSEAAHLIADQVDALENRNLLHRKHALIIGGAAAVLHGIRRPHTLFDRLIDIDVYAADSNDLYRPFPGAQIGYHTARHQGRRTVRLVPETPGEHFAFDLIMMNGQDREELLHYLDDESVPTISDTGVRVIKPTDALRLKVQTRRKLFDYHKRTQDKQDIARYRRLLDL